MTQSTKRKSLCNFFVLLLVRSLNFLIFREILKMSFLEYWKRFFKDFYRALNGDMGEKKQYWAMRVGFFWMIVIYVIILSIVLKFLFELGWLDWTF